MPRCEFCNQEYMGHHAHITGALGRADRYTGEIIGTAGRAYSVNPGVRGGGGRTTYPIGANIRWLGEGIFLSMTFHIFTTREALADDIGVRKRNTLLFEIMYLHAVGYTFVRAGGTVVATLTSAPRLPASTIDAMLEEAEKSLDVDYPTFWERWREHFVAQVLPNFPAAAGGAAAAPVAATAMFQLHLQNDANGMQPQFRASLNRSPQAISIRLAGQFVGIAATHWAWHRGSVLRVEGPAGLDAQFRANARRTALVEFNNPDRGFSLSVVNITPDA